MRIFSAKFPRVLILSASFATYAAGLSYLGAAEKNEINFQKALQKLKPTPQQAREKSLKMEMFGAIGQRAPLMEEAERWRLTQAVVKYSLENGHDPYLLLAVIETESAYRFDAVSVKGAVGFMQVRPFVAKSIAGEMESPAGLDAGDLTDMDTNLRLGSYYLSKMKGQFKSVDLALVAYNQGPTKLSEDLRYGRELDMRYTRKVLNSRESIRKAAPAGKRAA